MLRKSFPHTSRLEHLCCLRPNLEPLMGATENAGVENAIREKLQGWKMQEWKKQEQIAGVENAGVSRMERQPEIILRQP